MDSSRPREQDDGDYWRFNILQNSSLPNSRTHFRSNLNESRLDGDDDDGGSTSFDSTSTRSEADLTSTWTSQSKYPSISSTTKDSNKKGSKYYLDVRSPSLNKKNVDEESLNSDLDLNQNPKNELEISESLMQMYFNPEKLISYNSFWNVADSKIKERPSALLKNESLTQKEFYTLWKHVRRFPHLYPFEPESESDDLDTTYHNTAKAQMHHDHDPLEKEYSKILLEDIPLAPIRAREHFFPWSPIKDTKVLKSTREKYQQYKKKYPHLPPLTSHDFKFNPASVQFYMKKAQLWDSLASREKALTLSKIKTSSTCKKNPISGMSAPISQVEILKPPFRSTVSSNPINLKNKTTQSQAFELCPAPSARITLPGPWTLNYPPKSSTPSTPATLPKTVYPTVLNLPPPVSNSFYVRPYRSMLASAKGQNILHGYGNYNWTNPMEFDTSLSFERAKAALNIQMVRLKHAKMKFP